ncbi:MAG: Hpt domain-containing protein [Betaproteobacteria bacterium]
MSEAFDTGPLSWVKDEINQSLKKVLDSFKMVAEAPAEFASLRFTTAHLYQVSGALDMVGLEGCKRYCYEIEKLTSKLEKQEIPVSQSVMADMIYAIETLGRYLQDLLNGMQDTSVSLYESLKPLVEVQGETLEMSDLFFPDTSNSAPKDLMVNPIAESAIPIFVAEKRVAFQKSLLDWLRTKDVDSVNGMREAILNVQQVQQKNAQKTLWWAATAFMDAIGQDKVAAHTSAKKLCRRLDQQLRKISVGDAKIPSQLLRDLLYYVAISDPDTDTISRVKDIFELDNALPADDKVVGQKAVANATERAALAQLNADLPTLKELWSGISAGDNADGTDFDAFIKKLDYLTTVLQGLNSQYATKLLNAIHATALALQADQTKINETAFIEVAAAINLLEYIGEHYPQLDTDAQQKISTQLARLQVIVEGEALEPAVDAFSTAKLDDDVVSAVAKQILGALQVAEKALDTFFRNPNDNAVLDEATNPLQQISAAFDMLEMPLPKSIVQLCAVYVEYFQNNSNHSNSSNFELLAESLSMIGLYAEELPHARAESELALSGALQRLELGALSLDSMVESSAQDNQQEAIDLDLGQSLSFENTAVGDIAALAEGIFTDKALDIELQDIFLTEVEDLLASLAQHLQALRVNATDGEALIEVRRAYHTLKGSGRTVGLLGMSEVAWSVEKLLNLIIEHKAFPTHKQLDFVEKVSAEFAGWISDLHANQEVSLNPSPLIKKAAELALEFQLAMATTQTKPQKEEVLIGGTRTLSRAFFNIFLDEAQQHLQVLIEAQSGLQANSNELPSAESCRAAHTLGSNALTAGFKPTGDLARALEYWLDEHTCAWTGQQITLYGNVVKALESGLEKAKALKNPKSTRSLINALEQSKATMQAVATQKAEDTVLALDHAAYTLEKATKKSKDNAEDLGVIDKTSPQIKSLVNGIDTPDINVTTLNLPEGLTEPEHLSGDLTKTVKPDLLGILARPRGDVAVDHELFGLFLEEARELLPLLGKDLRGWRTHPNERDYPDSIQRVLHTLKGSARMVGQSEIGDAVHNMEDSVIHALKQTATSDDFDEMFVEFDHIGDMLEEVSGGGALSNSDAAIKDTGSGLTNALVSERSVVHKSQFLRMRADVLDRLINEAGEVSIMRSRMDREMQDFKQSSTDLTDSISRLRSYLRELEIEAETQMQSRMSLLQEANETFDPLELDRFTRLQELTRMMAESVNDVATIQHGILLNLDQTDAALQQQNRMNRELQKGLMGVRMLSFANISERLQRIVRQTARELNKRVEMTIDGEGIELDRGVLEKMAAPLEHLLRNAVVHGIESTEERIRLGKSEVGQIKLKVSLENEEITLVVTDDGRGIDLNKVRERAIETGLFTADQVLTDQAVAAAIFEHGFTTADSVSQIAGRGVGLDAVRSDIAALSGRIDVSNVVGKGAVFNIYLPVTLSVAQVVMVRVANKIYAIPSVMVEQAQKLKQNDLVNAYKASQVDWAGREYPLHFLSKLVGDAGHIAEYNTYTPVILLRSGIYRTALHVDEIMGNQEVVMKQMGTQLARVPGMIGATVLGDGAIVFVINPVQLANREALSIGAISVATFAPVVAHVRKVALVVDDSLTMRKVLSRVLEREDFEVITANDGMDAIQKLQSFTPDIILTDIEMPRMDGFEFTRYVRDNEKTLNIPLIIISSRTAEKHRNVAKELGVNAYLGKPVQDDVLMEQVNALLQR